mgnify:CR=1 FL=1
MPSYKNRRILGFKPWSWEEIKTYMADRPDNKNFLGSKISE